MTAGQVPAIWEEDELGFAAEMMGWSSTRHLPVIRDGKVVGVLSEGDLLVH